MSAISEIIDNAYDPDVHATQICIEMEPIDGFLCLTFSDDGTGVDEATMMKMLSFGYSEKIKKNNIDPIGRYGIGFKAGTMRLGKDALVISKQANTVSVGLLSRTFLDEESKDTIEVATVTFDRHTHKVRGGLTEQAVYALEVIFKYSVLKNERAIFEQADLIPGKMHGTRILVWNLNYNDIDFESCNADIIDKTAEDEGAHRRSLRKLCQIIYLVPRMKIYVRGKKVQCSLISKMLTKVQYDTYQPKGSLGPAPITFGYMKKAAEEETFGINFYHKKRLIKAWERIGPQKLAQPQGIGVVCVIEVDNLNLTPTHTKQDFMRDEQYNRMMGALKIKLVEYLKDVCGSATAGVGSLLPFDADAELEEWVQCMTCCKWRRLPYGVPLPGEDDMWVCANNTMPGYDNCSIPEEKLALNEVDIIQARGGSRRPLRMPRRSKAVMARQSSSCNSSHMLSPGPAVPSPEVVTLSSSSSDSEADGEDGSVAANCSLNSSSCVAYPTIGTEIRSTLSINERLTPSPAVTAEALMNGCVAENGVSSSMASPAARSEARKQKRIAVQDERKKQQMMASFTDTLDYVDRLLNIRHDERLVKCSKCLQQRVLPRDAIVLDESLWECSMHSNTRYLAQCNRTVNKMALAVDLPYETFHFKRPKLECNKSGSSSEGLEARNLVAVPASDTDDETSSCCSLTGVEFVDIEAQEMQLNRLKELADKLVDELHKHVVKVEKKDVGSQAESDRNVPQNQLDIVTADLRAKTTELSALRKEHHLLEENAELLIRFLLPQLQVDRRQLNYYMTEIVRANEHQSG